MIFVTGDTHGRDKLGSFSVDGYMVRLNNQNFPEQAEMTKEDYVIILGDFGGVWEPGRYSFSEPESEREGLDWLQKRPFTTLIIPGNHDNYDRIFGIKDKEILNSWFYADMPDSEKEKLKKGYPRKTFKGGFVRELRPSVLVLENGVFELEGQKIFVFGGAQSHDISGGILNPADFDYEEDFEAAYAELSSGLLPFRVKGISWWSEEQPTDADEGAAFNTLRAHDMSVDFILTHSPSASDQALMGFSAGTKIDLFLEEIKQTVTYKHWFSGHCHRNTNIPGGKDHVIYEQIVRIH